MAKKVKLGEKANSFFDPISKLKLLPGQVVELTKENQTSKKVQTALRQGHISYTDEELTVTNKTEEVKNPDNKDKDVFDASKVELNEKGLKGLKKSQLVATALFNKASYIDDDEKEVEYTQEELEELTIDEIKEVLLEEE